MVVKVNRKGHSVSEKTKQNKQKNNEEEEI